MNQLGLSRIACAAVESTQIAGIACNHSARCCHPRSLGWRIGAPVPQSVTMYYYNFYYTVSTSLLHVITSSLLPIITFCVITLLLHHYYVLLHNHNYLSLRHHYYINYYMLPAGQLADNCRQPTERCCFSWFEYSHFNILDSFSDCSYWLETETHKSGWWIPIVDRSLIKINSGLGGTYLF